MITYVRVFAWFVFGGERKLATITLKQNQGQHNFYSVEALEINEDAESERTPRGAISKDLNSAPLQNLASQLVSKIAYYVGDVNRTQPSFVASTESFSVERAASEILMMGGASGMTQTDLTVIILTGNEELHIGRCLEKLRDLNPQRVVVVDSESTDETRQIAAGTGAEVVVHPWPGNQAAQFNWFVDNYTIDTEWVLRIDADEWLTPELIEEIKAMLPTMPEDVAGVVFKRRHYFAGGWAKRGTYPVRILRLFRKGKARYADNMVMDEHLIVDGKTVEFDHDFVDESLFSMDQWREKHRGYAKREAQMVIEGKVNGNKVAYYRLPPYLRAVAYFCIRYFLKGGFLDGYAGWMWNFWQGLWYRCLVDREIGRLRKQKRF